MFLLTSFYVDILFVLIFECNQLINKLLFNVNFFVKKVAVLDF